MSDVMAWWHYMDAVRWKLQQIWLRTWYHSIRHVSFENQREKLLDWCPSIRHANLNCETLVGKIIATLSMPDTCLVVQWDSIAMSLQLQQLCILTNNYVFWPSITSTNTTAVQTCLLVEWCARWVLAGPLPLNQYACRSFTTQSECLSIFYHSISMPVDLLQLNQYACRSFTTQSVCLSIFNHSFLHACWCCVSLFAIPACMVSHYQPCLLLCSLTIGHAFRCDASLSAMPSGVLSHHRPRLLVWSLIINHTHWCGASL